MPGQRNSDKAIAEQVGLALLQRRLHKNIKQDDLARAVGVSSSTLHRLEKGKGSLQLLVAVLEVLNELDLLASLLTPPRISPRAVASTGKTHRVRAAGSLPDDRVNRPVYPMAPSDPIQGQPSHLLIPRRKRG